MHDGELRLDQKQSVMSDQWPVGTYYCRPHSFFLSASIDILPEIGFPCVCRSSQTQHCLFSHCTTILFFKIESSESLVTTKYDILCKTF